MGQEREVEAKIEFVQDTFSKEERELIATLAAQPEGGGDILDPEVQTLLLKWEGEQREVLEENYGDKSRIWLDWRKGLLYFEAGFNYEAFVSLEAALEQALNQSETGLQKAIEADIAKLERQVYQ